MRFLGKFVGGEEEKKNTFSVQCLSQIPSILKSQFEGEVYLFEGLYTNKKNERIFADLKKKS